jgi:triacylglycerol lipase
MSVRLRITCTVALCAMLSSTALVLGVGIAAACSGVGGGGECQAPTVSTGSATSITSNSATLTGSVNPQGCETTYSFEYGTASSGSYPNSISSSAGNGTSPKSVQTNSPLGLQPSTKYNFRLSAINSEGMKTTGSVGFFSTQSAEEAKCKPIAITGAASEITGFSAVLNGTAGVGQFCVGSYKFEWGPSSSPNSYPKITPITLIPNSSSPVSVSVKIGGLAGSTSYHYRLTSVSEETTSGADKTFTTKAAATRDPILFVHGWESDSSTWNEMKSWFHDWGWPLSRLYTIDYDSNQPNEDIGELIRTQVNLMLAQTGAPKIDIIAHSMGSLSSRFYLKFLGGTSKVEDWVSLAGPNHGTTTIVGCIFLGCEDMKVNSPFLQKLNAGDETPGAVRYATWRSFCDGAVEPPISVALDGAVQNILAPCILHIYIHKYLPIFEEVRKFVE